MTNDLARAIDSAWDARESLGPSTKGEIRDAVETVLAVVREVLQKKR